MFNKNDGIIDESADDCHESLIVRDNARATLNSDSPSQQTLGIRVDVGLLDKLMTLVGELVLARNQVLQVAADREDSTFSAATQRLNLITTELQEGVMKARMQPIENVWTTFPRVVRDLALNCGKKIEIELEGQDTELDKNIIEAIKAPLMHIVRNSVDHGIETPEKRLEAGKPAEGRLQLSAFREGGQVTIEISDDGAGIDSACLLQRAIQRGLIAAEQATRVTPREMLNLIFLPGLSTSGVSERGGMEVVKTNIEKIGGTVDIQSRPGQGTAIRIKIPITLAIIPALIVSSGGERYAIPQVNLLELVRLEDETAGKCVEIIQGMPVCRLRGRLLPLTYLNRELGMEAAVQAGSTGESTNVVVLQADDRTFGLIVDDVNDTEDIVVKPLGKQLKGISVYAGATILGDGHVALILDILGIAQRANVLPEVRECNVAAKAEISAPEILETENAQSLLLFGCGRDRMAVPLSLVARLEKFDVSLIESSGELDVVQYRGQIIPLIYIDEVLKHGRNVPAPRSENNADCPLDVIVYAQQGRCAGLVVGRILDIVEEAVTLQRQNSRRGILGSMVIQGRVTELLDIDGIVQSIDPQVSFNPADRKASA